jgi:hypothetical protein
MEFRLAVDSDNDAILELADRCPQEGMISFTVHRKPQFDTLLKQLDANSWHYLASDGKKVISLIGVIHFNALIHGSPKKCAYVMDFRVDPLYRSTTITYRLVKGAIDRILASDADFVIGNFLKANEKPAVFASGRAGLPPGHHLGDNRVFNIIPWRKLKIDSRYTIRQANLDDIPRLAELYKKYASFFRLSTTVDQHRIESITKTIQGLSIHHFYVACEGENIRAVTALWDEFPYRHYQVKQVNAQIRWVNRIVRTIGLFYPMPKPIEMNKPLKQQSLVLYAHDDDPRALANLFRYINNKQLGSDCTLLSLYTRDNDPIIPYLSGLNGISINSEMFFYAKDMTQYDTLLNMKSSDWLDLSIVI